MDFVPEIERTKIMWLIFDTYLQYGGMWQKYEIQTGQAVVSQKSCWFWKGLSTCVPLPKVYHLSKIVWSKLLVSKFTVTFLSSKKATFLFKSKFVVQQVVDFKRHMNMVKQIFEPGFSSLGVNILVIETYFGRNRCHVIAQNIDSKTCRTYDSPFT